MSEITHRDDNGKMKQIVSPERLKEILDADGDDYSRPSSYGPGDEWEVAGTEDEAKEKRARAIVRNAVKSVEDVAHVRSYDDHAAIMEIEISVSVADGDKFDPSCDEAEKNVLDAVGPGWDFAWNGSGNTDNYGDSTEDATLRYVG